MRRAKKSLGKVLLKSFRKASGTKRPLRKASFNRTPYFLRLSEMNPPSLSKLQRISKNDSLPALTRSDATIGAAEISPPVLPAVQPIIPESLIPAHRKIEEVQLSTLDILKPNDPLRQSIEGFLADQRSEHTRRAYGRDLKRFIKFLYGRSHQNGFEGLNRTILIAHKEGLLSEGLEHTTVDRHLATLKSFFKWLVDDGHLIRSPADGVRFLNPKRVSRTIGFSDEEVRKILTMPDLHTRTGSLHYAVLMVLFYCGLRRSEVCGLQISNLGMERGQRILRLRGKGNAERVIVVIQPVWNALNYYAYIANRDLKKEGYLFIPLRNNRTGILNKPLDPSMIFYIVTKYAKLAGIANRVSPHSCRATAISNARDHNVPDRAIQEFAGWASPDMITRYDKRKSIIENSAAHSISYGAENRVAPVPVLKISDEQIKPKI